ncbi:MAG: hypothetical protein E6Q95_00665 [Chitinophagaceae bacterium]|nr:MAG: hypothetical protein E6Q95_00665 [Chitinophagaceae bacterium]
MHIHFIQHESFEAPGAYLHWAEQNLLQISFTKLFLHQSLPETIDDIDILVILGGPQSPDTTTAECSYFNAAAEISIIQKCIRANKIVIGVCLGAQLIGESLGAKYEHSPEKEIGNFPILITEKGKQNHLINHMNSETIVGHWHNDMPGLTSESTILATSNGCPRQIVQYSPGVYGLQCHLEFNQELVAGLIHHEMNLQQLSTTHPFVQNSEAILHYNYDEMNNALYQFLNKLCLS